MLERSKIDAKYKWDLKDIYPDLDAWRKDLDILRGMLDQAESFKGKLGNSDTLLQYYDYSKKQDILMDKVYVYVMFEHMIDMDNDKYNRLVAEVENLAQEFAVKSAYVLPELNSYPVEYLKSLLQDPRFELHYMDIEDLIKYKPHILSHEEQAIVTKVGNWSGSFSDIFDGYDTVDVTFDDALDSKGEKHEVTNANYGRLMKNRDRTLRKNAYESMFGAYKRVATTIANNYIGSVKKDWFYSDVHKYSSVLQANLDGNDLTEKLYYNLIDNINKHLYLNHRWVELKKKIFKLDKIYPYDLSVPICTLDKEYTYEEAKDIVVNALSVLGDDYREMLLTALDNNWIDVFPTKNKDTGGCCVSVYDVHPRILMNYDNTASDVSTLAHELGHALHHCYTVLSQPYEYTDVSIFLAEMASTTNEVLLKKYMYNHASDKEEKLYILQEFISLITGSLYVQTLFSEYEDFAHKMVERGEPLTKEMLLDKYGELQAKYSGSGVESTDLRKYGCLYVPHFYRAYYVYSYATGITCAVNFAKMCLDGADGVAKYRKFLASGSSKYPMDLLSDCGIDLESDKPYEVIFGELKWAMDEIEKLID